MLQIGNHADLGRTKTMTHIYSCHKTFERAAEALEDYFATGEVCEGEHPEIRARYIYTPHKRKVFDVIINID